MKEIIEDGEDGYLIDDDDAQILAQKMNMLLLDNKITQNVRKKERDIYSEIFLGKNCRRDGESYLK